MSQSSRRSSLYFFARNPEYIRIEEDEVQSQTEQPQATKPLQLRNVAKGEPIKRRADGSFSKADVLNSLVPIHHAQWGGYTPKEITPKKKSSTCSSSTSLASSSSLITTNTHTIFDPALQDRELFSEELSSAILSS
ncbi:hypothetical protein BGW41_007974 [Actinomortierella wolfii]|nr:hypothetical protein BGW41_007974 [Actinomortierella wolfii]